MRCVLLHPFAAFSHSELSSEYFRHSPTQAEFGVKKYDASNRTHSISLPLIDAPNSLDKAKRLPAGKAEILVHPTRRAPL